MRPSLTAKCPMLLTLVSSVCVLSFVWPTFATPPAAPGGKMPPHIRRFVRQNQVSIHTPGAWRGTALRAKNRRLQAAALGTAAGANATAQAATVLGGTKFVPVVLVGFDNISMPANVQADLEDELFTGPWPTQTLTEFYDEISYSNLTLSGEVIDAGDLSQDDTFYEGSGVCSGARTTCSTPAGCPVGETCDPANGRGPDSNIGTLIRDAIASIDGTVDFGRYDNDGDDGIPNSGDDDGRVDLIAFVHPEKGAECGAAVPAALNNLWSFYGQFDEPGIETEDDSANGGKIRLIDVTVQPAQSCDGGLIEIGVFCHEFGHALGLPDLYDVGTDAAGDTSDGLGEWCLMAGGNWNEPTNPAQMCAWAKTELGWITPTLLTAAEGSVEVPEVETNPVAFKIVTGERGREYFLIENRQPVGSDVNLFTCGLAIYHIDETQTNNDNPNCGAVTSGGANYMIALEQADGSCDLATNTDFNVGDAGDLFPGSTSNSEFTSTTTPNSRPYIGADIGVSITNISACGPTMTFDYDAFPLPPTLGIPLDIVFLMDISGSYIDDLILIKEQLTDIVNDIRNVFPDARIGLASFKDFPLDGFGGPGDWAYKLELPLTADATPETSAFQQAFAALVAGGGADLPESQYEALLQLMTGKGLDLDGDGVSGNSTGEIAPSDMDWNSARAPVIYLLTDASFHDSDAEVYPVSSVLKAAGRSDVANELAAPSVLSLTPSVFIINADVDGPDISSGQDGEAGPFPFSRLERQATELATLSRGAFLAGGTNTVNLRGAIQISLEILAARFPEVGPCCVGATCIEGTVKPDCEALLGGRFASECDDCLESTCGDGLCTGFEVPCTCLQDCGSPPASESGGLCSDRIDNDCDGLTDCSDNGCANSSACTTCAPRFDATNDLTISVADWNFYPACMLESGGLSNLCIAFDSNCDDVVNLLDVSVFQNLFRVCVPGVPCSDNNACTTGDSCFQGVCAGGPERVCDDGNDCTDDACDPGSGCVFTPNDANDCNDDTVCNGEESCEGGACVAGTPLDCDDGNPCTNDSCDPDLGCQHVNNTASCNDGNACSRADSCADGTCQGFDFVDCDDGNVCTTDSCNAATGVCDIVANALLCDDGNACTQTDTCASGSCNGTDPLTCNDGNPCTNDTCQPATGCVFAPDDANLCADANTCDGEETCKGGVCTNGTSLECADVNPCTDDSCDPFSGCRHVNNNDGCDDGNLCTQVDFCVAGSCTGFNSITCDDTNVCTNDSCNPASGACEFVSNTAPCSDGNACTQTDTCSGGTCIGSNPVLCNDGNTCTNDNCIPGSGACQFANNTAPCDDGQFCNGNDTCSGGSCLAENVDPCLGGPECKDSCNEATDSCFDSFGTACTDDGNECTDNVCNGSGTCVPLSNSNPCDDGVFCNGDDSCGSGTCSVHGFSPCLFGVCCEAGEFCCPFGFICGATTCLCPPLGCP